jgi:hypothetical protein
MTIGGDGELALEDGASLSTTGALSNNNSLYVDGGSLRLGGGVMNSGTFIYRTQGSGGTYTQKVGWADVDGTLMAPAWILPAGIWPAKEPLTWIIHEQGGKGKLGVFRTL